MAHTETLSDAQIHAATLIRLNVAVAALQIAARELRRVTNDRGEQYRETTRLIGAALRIAFGTETEVPEALSENSTLSVMQDPAAMRRLLTATGIGGN